MLDITKREEIFREYLQGLEDSITQSLQFTDSITLSNEVRKELKNYLLTPERYEQCFDGREDVRIISFTVLYKALVSIRFYHFVNNPNIEDAKQLPGSFCLPYEEVYDILTRQTSYARLQILNQIHCAEKYKLLEEALIDLNKESFLKLKDSGVLAPLQYIGGFCSQLEKNLCPDLSIVRIDNIGNDVNTIISETNDHAKLFSSNVRMPSIGENSNLEFLVENVVDILEEIENYNDFEKEIISKYLDKPLFKKTCDYYANLYKYAKNGTKVDTDKCGWLPEDFFDFKNIPQGGDNWINGLLPEVEKGYKYLGDDKEKKDAREKFAMMIELCVQEGLIHDDIVSKKRLAYVLTGRNVGIIINEEKVLAINEDKLPFLVYIVRFLFNKNGKYEKMFRVFEGIGYYQSNVRSVKELNEQKESSLTHSPKIISGLAERAVVFKTFAPSMHSLYDFCPESKEALKKMCFNRKTENEEKIRKKEEYKANREERKMKNS